MFQIVPLEEINYSQNLGTILFNLIYLNLKCIGYDRTKAEIMKRLKPSAFHGGLPGKLNKNSL